MSIAGSSSTSDYWQAFAAATGSDTASHTVVAFGDSPEMGDALLALVLSGRKRATASLVRDYAARGEPLPRKGDFAIVVDGRGHPKCIFRTAEVVVKPLADVDDAFAWDEGEGDRTRDYWLRAHRQYFSAQAEREGFDMDDGIETVFERFEIVWPLEVADR